MKNVLILLAFATLSCTNQQRDCKEFHEGKFKFDHSINGKTMTTYFERKGDVEIETFQGKTDTATVRWVSDCEYILQKKNPKNMQEKKAIAMKILTTSKNSYTFEFGVVGGDSRQKGTVTKLN